MPGEVAAELAAKRFHYSCEKEYEAEFLEKLRAKVMEKLAKKFAARVKTDKERSEDEMER